MTKPGTFVVALSLCATFACSDQGPMATNPAAPTSPEATNAKPGAGDHPVISTIATGHDIAGDGATYTNSSILKSVIAANNGVWYLDLTNRSNLDRVVNLTLVPTSVPPGAPAAPPSGAYKVFMYIPCNGDNYKTEDNFFGNPLAMTLNSTMVCPMTVQFTDDLTGKRYYLHMNSRNSSLAPGTEDVNITCVAMSGADCSEWQVLPTGEGNVARLSYQAKGNSPFVLVGTYDMSFEINLKK